MIRAAVALALALSGALGGDVYYPEPGSTPPPENYNEGDDPARPPDVWPEPAAPAKVAEVAPTFTG